MFYLRITHAAVDYYWNQSDECWTSADKATEFPSSEMARAERRFAAFQWSGQINIVEKL